MIKEIREAINKQCKPDDKIENFEIHITEKYLDELNDTYLDLGRLHNYKDFDGIPFLIVSDVKDFEVKRR